MTQASKILVVDEEPAFSQLLLMLLSGRGYEVEAVSTSQEALLGDNSGTDLILLDTTLPDHEGLKVCRLLKTNAHTQHIPIIVLGANQNGDKIESFHLGADDYLAKPFDPEELFARVEVALRHGHSLAHEESTRASYEIIQEIHQIIDEESIVPHYQPIYLLNPLRLFGLEVLSRPQTKGKLSNPEVLFKAALRYGLYYEVEMIVWRKAIEAARRTFEHEQLFLNCNPYLIESDRFEEVKNLFQHSGMAARHVCFEITERSTISGYDIFFERLLNYRQQGFKLAIDDVGAGYASLEAIMHTKPDVVKIDRQIVIGMAQDIFKRSIVKLIVAFCRENDIICIAEGIETKQDLEILIELGVPAGQGYYLYKPTGSIDLNAMRAITV